jgi:hypothetical protein
VSEPDLTAELDAAEDIEMGRVDAVVTEWGVRRPSGGVFSTSDDETMARFIAKGQGTVVRRTVTYSPWEEAPE